LVINTTSGLKEKIFENDGWGSVEVVRRDRKK
jgi:hypothetical protein